MNSVMENRSISITNSPPSQLITGLENTHINDEITDDSCSDRPSGEKSQEEANLASSDCPKTPDSVLLAVDSYGEDTFESNFDDVRKHSGTISEIEKTYSPDGKKEFCEGKISSSPPPSQEIVSPNLDEIAKFEANEGDVEDIEENDEHENSCLHQDDRHVFVLSEAGKPIYSRHGSEDRLVTIMGVMQALISFVLDTNDVLRSISTGEDGHVFVFLMRTPIILVAVSKCGESETQLIIKLNYIYNQILSFLSYTRLSSVFEQRRNYDLRRLLTSCDKLIIDNLVDLFDSEPGLFLGAVRCLPLSSSIREIISQVIIQSCNKAKNLVFAIMIIDGKLVTLVRMKKYHLHPADLHLIINMVDSTDSFKGAESWTPICLPKFDSSGFLHAHISYLDDSNSACLLLLTVDKDAFFSLAESRQKIIDKLRRNNHIGALMDACNKSSFVASELGISDLRHFMYKMKSLSQYTSPILSALPYKTIKESKRLFRRYQSLHHRVHSSARPLKILLHVGEHETMLGWVTSSFELYVTFEPLVTKSSAINAVNKVIKWVKKEEDRLFILTAPVF